MLLPALGILEEEALWGCQAPRNPGPVQPPAPPHPTSCLCGSWFVSPLGPAWLAGAAKGSCDFRAELACFVLWPQPHSSPSRPGASPWETGGRLSRSSAGDTGEG